MSDNQTQAVPRKITLGFIVGWIWGVLCIIAGVSGLVEGQAVPGILFLVMAAIALPPANDFVASQMKIALSGWLRFIAIIVLLFVIGSQLKSPRVGEGGNTSASSTATASAPSKPIQPKKLLDIEGSGTKSTEKFTTQGDDWDLQYAYDCSNFGGSGNFIVDAKAGDGAFSGVPPVNELGRSGSDTEHYHTGGTFYLEVNSECSWHVVIYG